MQRGKPFENGNKLGVGRPKGSKNRATLEREALIDGCATAILKKSASEALKGNNSVLGTWTKRLVPPARQPQPAFKLPPIRSAADLWRASESVLKAMAAGALSPQEGESFISVIERCLKLHEAHDVTVRVKALEQRASEAIGIELVAEADRTPQKDGADTGEAHDAE